LQIASFKKKSENKNASIGILFKNKILDVRNASKHFNNENFNFPDTIKLLLEKGDSEIQNLEKLVSLANEYFEVVSDSCYEFNDIIFFPPIANAHKLLCVGKNYKAHLEELKRTDLINELPHEPTGFIKINECLTGHDTIVKRPLTVTRLDYEPELVFVIGKRAFEVTEKDAFSYVYGITILNDLTCRDTQKSEVASGSRFWTSKNAPGFGPLGPFIISMDEVPDPYNIWVTCSVNGQERMRVNTSDQIWKLPRIIEHFSRLMPLMPGDMFSTGAPGGVAVGKTNAEDLFLKNGDIVECAFENPKMILRTHIVT